MSAKNAQSSRAQFETRALLFRALYCAVKSHAERSHAQLPACREMIWTIIACVYSQTYFILGNVQHNIASAVKLRKQTAEVDANLVNHGVDATQPTAKKKDQLAINESFLQVIQWKNSACFSRASLMLSLLLEISCSSSCAFFSNRVISCWRSENSFNIYMYKDQHYTKLWK